MRYQFADCTLDPSRRELRRGNALVPLEPQVFDLLEFLIQARDRVVSRDDLIAAVWHSRIVSEATLSSRINAARTAIGDSGIQQHLIRTLPRKGIRFVGAVQELPTAETTTPESKGPSIAVLPFTNMSGDPAQDYFADGIAEEITTALSRCSGLFVIARNSAFTYKGKSVDVRHIGRDLGVAYILEGSVRRDANRLRIAGQLIDAATGAHLWADRFDGNAHDVFDLQDRVAERVVAALEPTVQTAEIARLGHARPDAYDLLLRAHAHQAQFTAESMTAALDCLRQALTLDPAYAPAMAAFAYCRAQCHFQGWASPHDTDHNSGPKDAIRLAWRATELAPNDAQVLWMSAFAIWNMADDREPARELFRRSLLINPNSALALTLAGWIETMCGNQAQGREMLLRARRLNPRDPRDWFSAGALAIADVIDRNYTEAISWADKALAQNRRFAVALRVLAVALVKTGQQPRAAQTVKELLAIEPDLTISAFFARIPVPLADLARTYAEALRLAGLPD